MIFKQVFRIAFVTLIWKQYKAVIISTLLLFGYLFLVSSIHADYLTHTELQNDTSGTGLSFLYKWLAFAVGTGAYFLFHYARGRAKSKADKQTGGLLKTKAKKSNKTSQQTNIDEDDPFSAIREREKLRSKADFLEGKD